MKSAQRPYRMMYGMSALALAGMLIVGGVSEARAQAGALTQGIDLPSPLLRSSAQGYMGVLVGDVDQETASRLKLREARGAVVTLLDHDAPAAQAGMRVNDVVLEINGQKVENADQFSRTLRELPAGRKLTVVVSRDGAQQTLTLELVDRKKMEHDVWTRLDSGNDGTSAAPSMSMVAGNSSPNADISSGGFHMPFFGSALNVGAMVEPLTAQMAEYLGIKSGLMVKQVARKSEADAAGLKAFDIILKVGTDPITTAADWDRTLRTNQNKTVTVTVMRDRKQQTLVLQVDSRRRRSSAEAPRGTEDPVQLASAAK